MISKRKVILEELDKLNDSKYNNFKCYDCKQKFVFFIFIDETLVSLYGNYNKLKCVERTIDFDILLDENKDKLMKLRTEMIEEMREEINNKYNKGERFKCYMKSMKSILKMVQTPLEILSKTTKSILKKLKR